MIIKKLTSLESARFYRTKLEMKSLGTTLYGAPSAFMAGFLISFGGFMTEFSSENNVFFIIRCSFGCGIVGLGFYTILRTMAYTIDGK